MDFLIVPSLWVGKVYPYMGNSVYNGITKGIIGLNLMPHARVTIKLVRANGFAAIRVNLTN